MMTYDMNLGTVEKHNGEYYSCHRENLLQIDCATDMQTLYCQH